jgi:hypothetical protein
VRPWLGLRTLGELNAAAESSGLKTESGKAVRFVPPGERDAYYEVRVFESGCVATRADNLHDWLNALAWLAFPRTKARINALHAAEIPREGGRRGRKRDMLTIFDEGGAIVQGEPDLVELIRNFEWHELFWKQRARVLESMRFIVIGHAILEQALDPRPGITCRAVFVASGNVDAQVAAAIGRYASPQEMAPLPVFGFPGWLAQDESFYRDVRYFRPRGKMAAGAGQAAAVHNTEESPGSIERDAG